MRKQLDHVRRSDSYHIIGALVESGRLRGLHVDVMRPSLIQNRTVFPIELIKKLYQYFNRRTEMDLHLMARGPTDIVKEMNSIIGFDSRSNTSVTIQLEAFNMEVEATEALKNIRGVGYKVGIGLDLYTPIEKVTQNVVDNVDLILLMCVPMGKGGQKYDERSNRRIRHISRLYPHKTIEVDGGIDDKTALQALDAGAKRLVIGSYITGAKKPLCALQRVVDAIESC
ncbi:MAG: hypothetical protein ACUVQ8_03790 [Nitrososphaeria archaeon]